MRSTSSNCAVTCLHWSAGGSSRTSSRRRFNSITAVSKVSSSSQSGGPAPTGGVARYPRRVQDHEGVQSSVRGLCWSCGQCDWSQAFQPGRRVEVKLRPCLKSENGGDAHDGDRVAQPEIECHVVLERQIPRVAAQLFPHGGVEQSPQRPAFLVYLMTSEVRVGGLHDLAVPSQHLLRA